MLSGSDDDLDELPPDEAEQFATQREQHRDHDLDQLKQIFDAKGSVLALDRDEIVYREGYEVIADDPCVKRACVTHYLNLRREGALPVDGNYEELVSYIAASIRTNVEGGLVMRLYREIGNSDEIHEAATCVAICKLMNGD